MSELAKIALHFVQIAHAELKEAEKEESHMKVGDCDLKPYRDVYTCGPHVAAMAFEYAETFVKEAKKHEPEVDNELQIVP